MIRIFAYPYHRLLGITLLTIICAGSIKVDYSSRHFQRSKPSTMFLLQSELSSLKKANAWLNSPSLTETELRGKVILIQFCTYTCINWLRTLPYVRAWAEKYKEKGLVVIGVHTPEFSFEKNIDNVRRAIKDMKVDFPTAIDNNQDIWNAFKNQYWPALYLIDANGHIRHHQFGEGGYEQFEKVIQQLLIETGIKDIDPHNVEINARGVEVAADWSNLNSAENYLGYERTENFATSDLLHNKQHVYTASASLNVNQWALSGNWTAQKNSIILNNPGGRIVYRFYARDLHLVMGPAVQGTSIRFRVLINRKIPGRAHGIDIDEQGNGKITDQRLYQLIRQPNPIAPCEFQIEFLDPGVEAFSFTFG